MGAEGKGLRPRVAAACDVLVALPLHGRLESLNVNAAAAALLYGILQKAGLTAGHKSAIKRSPEGQPQVEERTAFTFAAGARGGVRH